MARICMKTLDQKTESEKKPSDNIEPQKEAGSEKQAQNTAISLPSSNTGKSVILDAMLDSGCSESFCSLETYERLREKNLVTSMSTDGAGPPIQFGNASYNKLLGRAVSHHCLLEDNTPLRIEWGVLQTLSPYPAVISLKTLRPKGAIWVISPAGDRLILGDPGDFLPISNAVCTPFHGLRGLVMNGITTVPSALAGQMAGIRDPSEVSPFEENPTDSVDENDVSVERDTLQLSSSTPPRVWIGEADETAPRGRLWVDIPWRSNERPPRSFAQAWHRDKSLRKRLTLAPEKLSMFQQQADLLVSEGYAEPIDSDLPRYPPSEIDAIDKHYISIVPVFSAARSTRCRLCLDARVANKYTRPGWHDPKALLEALVGWRLYVWIGLFDISKAFWRIYIPTDQRSWLCCVVCSRRLRFRSLPFGLNFSPCALLEGTTLIKNALIELLKDTSGIAPKEDAQEESAVKYDHQDVDHTTPEPPRPKKIKCEMYVDDGQVRENQNPNHGRRQLHWVRWGFGQHGFPSMGSKAGGNFDIPESVIVAEWEPVRIRQTSQHLQNVSPDSSQWIPFLGYKWDPNTDVVVQFFPVLEPAEQEALETQTNVTRRMVISVAQRWHDPLGLFLTEGSLTRWIASKAIHSTQEWEQAVSPEIAKELSQWVTYMQSSLHVAPRYCSPKEIFIFSDASITGWSVEIRDHSMRLLYARSGIFPPECRYTIPRKETEAAVRAAETLDKYLTALPEDDDMPSPLIKGLYTDSEILIHRLRGGDRMLKGLSAVERRRIGKIADAVKNHKTICCHIPGSINPSDGASRADQYGPPNDEALKETSLKWDSAIASELNELPIDSYLCDPNDRTVSLMNPLNSRLTRLECLPAAIADIKAYQDRDRWCSRLKDLIGRNDAPKWTKEFEIDPAGLIRRRSPPATRRCQ
ncbi:hypothetical protein FOZ63_032249 [Perkinsus olseni]|uniref:Uncharacterized protein n=2 Tax=Perkinsus olseni TaxID=32597 RepID=A0A7J6PZQ6_PEROL|nr:hypothetical protein FOZ63_032249 [Perkinsus olseni]